VPKVHHSAICTTDLETSLRFWRDGLSFEVQLDHVFEGDWPTLFGVESKQLRSIFLGDPADQTGGIVELVEFALPPVQRAPAQVFIGFFLVSVFTDVSAALDRLEHLGLGGVPSRTSLSGVDMAVVWDPNGVRVELIGLPENSEVNAAR
jgi:catechol 2,3-dioxygenase-like lactoylglutathione lyase family enzyme